MSKDLQPVRGTRDILGADIELQNIVTSTAKEWANKYNFKEFSTPIFEFSDVFHRTLGDTSDIVSKETYTFLDREKTSITLRPEFTAGIVRALISNGLTQSLPQKLYSWGPVFRHERPQKARYRQFNQINFEYIGAKNPFCDVELIAIAHHILKSLGLAQHVALEINSLGDLESRNNYRTALSSFLDKYKNDLSEDSKMRLEKNPLRILDSKDANDHKILANAPKIADHFTDSAKQFFERVLAGLTELGIEYKLNSKLVRGLDYYTHTVFEFTTQLLGSQGTVLAGGRYNGLVELMGGPSIPAVGFAAGVERLYELMKALEYKLLTEKVVSLIPIGERAEKEALKIARMLREKNICVDLEYAGNIGKMMKRADKISATHAIIFGDDELKAGNIKVKNLKDGTENIVAISELFSSLQS
jgi:histidyl-tRNA synthetase